MISHVLEVSAKEARYQAKGKRDPFAPLVSLNSKSGASGLVGAESADDIRMEGVVYDPVRGSVVMVNGTFLKEGEELAGLKVVSIAPDGATFLVNGNRVYKPTHQDGHKERVVQ